MSEPQFKEPRRFWSKVGVGEVGECWEWQATKGRYGQFWIHGRYWQAHRVAWVLTYGPIPAGLLVCHRCDNPSCVNPYHLFLGTQSDNKIDSAKKGRISRKLTPGEVHEIRLMLEEGYTQLEIADAYGVSGTIIGFIKHGRNWDWL